MRDKPSVIPKGVIVTGEIEGDVDLIVLGRVDGPIRVGGTLVIETGGLVRGHIYGRRVRVCGAVKGNAFAEETIVVASGAKLVGDLTAPRVQVVPGARFRGQLNVAPGDEPLLRTYDPSKHTFSGAAVPTVVDEIAPRLGDLPQLDQAPGGPPHEDLPRADGSLERRHLEHPPLIEERPPDVGHLEGPPLPADPLQAESLDDRHLEDRLTIPIPRSAPSSDAVTVEAALSEVVDPLPPVADEPAPPSSRRRRRRSAPRAMPRIGRAGGRIRRGSDS